MAEGEESEEEEGVRGRGSFPWAAEVDEVAPGCTGDLIRVRVRDRDIDGELIGQRHFRKGSEGQ